MIDSLTIQKLVVETYGKRPIARPFIAHKRRTSLIGKCRFV